MLGSFIRDCILGKTGQHTLWTKTEVPTYVQTQKFYTALLRTQKSILPQYKLKNSIPHTLVYTQTKLLCSSATCRWRQLKQSEFTALVPGKHGFMVDQAKE